MTEHIVLRYGRETLCGKMRPVWKTRQERLDSKVGPSDCPDCNTILAFKNGARITPESADLIRTYMQRKSLRAR